MSDMHYAPPGTFVLDIDVQVGQVTNAVSGDTRLLLVITEKPSGALRQYLLESAGARQIAQMLIERADKLDGSGADFREH